MQIRITKLVKVVVLANSYTVISIIKLVKIVNYGNSSYSHIHPLGSSSYILSKFARLFMLIELICNYF